MEEIICIFEHKRPMYSRFRKLSTRPAQHQQLEYNQKNYGKKTARKMENLIVTQIANHANSNLNIKMTNGLITVPSEKDAI